MKRTALIVLDGLGLAPPAQGNAVSPETMPFLHELMARYGHASLAASGAAVGLDEGQAGNSEVGHLTIGAGRRIGTTLARVRAGFISGAWAQSPVWKTMPMSRPVHVVGLLSDAGVHAHYSSLMQAAQLALGAGAPQVHLHLFLDGVDSAKGSATAFMAEILSFVQAHARVKLGSVSGRKWACDRSGDLSLTRHCVDGLAGRLPSRPFAMASLQAHLDQGSGESSFPFHADPDAAIAQDDVVILCNHRADRITQLAGWLSQVARVHSLIELGEAVEKARVFFPVMTVTGGLVDTLNEHGIQMARVAESCKFPHVTYFLNGMRELDALAIDVPSIAESDIPGNPAMSLTALCQEVCALMQKETQQSLIVNVPNLDQVGHTGDLASTKSAAGHVDQALRLFYEQASACGWQLLVTADHGNADQMLDNHGRPLGSHSINPVPLLAIDPLRPDRQLKATIGALSQVAPTFLSMCGIAPPSHMEPSLV